MIVGVVAGDPAPVAVLVQGSPGIGKTALTKAVGCHPDIVRNFGEAERWFVALDAATTAAAMRERIMRSVGVDPGRGFDAALELLRQRPGFLVLDNLETPWDPKAERHAVEDIVATLAAIPGMALLASFRGRDRVGGPTWALVHHVAHLDAPDDAELFRRIAQGRFANDPCLPRFMAALGGIPLAIELVASRAYGRASLAALWGEWTRIGTELAAHPDFDAGRLTSLPHSIELSLHSSRLTETSLRLFRLLGQLPAGIVAEDRDELLGEGGFAAEEALLRTGLAVERGGRLDLLPPIRDHAARHYPPGATDSIAWPGHYLVLTERSGELIDSREGQGAAARLLSEFDNIEAAIRSSLAAGRRVDVMNALSGFGFLTFLTSLPAPVLFDLAAACRADGDVRGEAQCNRSLGDISLERSDHTAARVAYEQALSLYRQMNDANGEADCIKSLGDVEFDRSDLAEAGAAYEQALARYRQLGDLVGQADSVKSLGDIALALSEQDVARSSYEQALAMYQRIGSVLGEANCIKSFGNIALTLSDYPTAKVAYDKALRLYRQLGRAVGEAHCIYGLGEIALAQSDFADARAAYEQALPIYRQVGDVRGEANCVNKLEELSRVELVEE